jgi:hypothetical protein
MERFFHSAAAARFSASLRNSVGIPLADKTAPPSTTRNPPFLISGRPFFQERLVNQPWHHRRVFVIVLRRFQDVGEARCVVERWGSLRGGRRYLSPYAAAAFSHVMLLRLKRTTPNAVYISPIARYRSSALPIT